LEKFASEPPEGLRVALWRCDTDHGDRRVKRTHFGVEIGPTL
jgi:hypothetical protein